MTSHKKKLFKETMEDMFVGESVSGDEGRQNLMSIKSQYYNDVYDQIEEKIDQKSENYQDNDAFKKEIYERIYDFFNKYFNEQGSIHFSNISVDEKTYEELYEDNDVKLFWKTHMLYYVKRKSEWNDLLVESYETNESRLNVKFDTSEISSQKVDIESISYRLDNVNEESVKISVLPNSKGSQSLDDIRRDINDQFKDFSLEDVKNIISIFQKQNTFDYFISKDCESFLKSQFDLWISQYLTDTQTKFSEKRIQQINDIKQIAYNIIEFVSEFEQEIKKVWMKRRLVKETNIVVTTDVISRRCGDQMLEEIMSDSGWENQLEEWQDLSIIDNIDDFKSLEDIKDISGMPIDSKHFDIDIYQRLSIGDNKLDGVFIMSENFQGMNTILEKFDSQVDSIYIDPPYNTGDDSFIYDDRYSRHAWLSFMNDRLNIANKFLSKDGCITAQCDDNEQAYLKVLMDEVMEEDKFINSTAVKMSTLSGPKMSHVGEDHMTKLPKLKEYLLTYGNKDFNFNTIKIDIDEWDDEYSRYLTNFSLEDYYAIKDFDQNEENVDDIAKRLENVDMISVSKMIDKEGIENPFEWKKDNAHRIIRTATSSSLLDLAENKELYNKNQLFYPAKSANGNLYIARTDYGRNVGRPRIEVLFAEDNLAKPPGDIWTDIKTTGLHNEGKVDFRNGKKPEKLIKRIISLTSDPNDTVMDFFVGSGTTCAVAQKMNRRWIGIDMDDIVENKSIPRLKRVLAYDDSGVSDHDNVKPIYNKEESGGMFKYIRLEQHEEILQNSSYKDSKNIENAYSDYRKYMFMNDKKLLDTIETDNEGNVDLTESFSFVDAAQNVSNVLGEKITDFDHPYVEYTDSRINMESVDINLVKELFYW